MKGWVLLALFALAGCRTVPVALPYHQRLANPVGEFELELPAPDREVVAQLAQALVGSGPALSSWGALSTPVTVQVFPSHQDFVAAIGHSGEPNLRAWSVTDRIFIQSPRSWSANGATQSQVDDLVTHELTHALMFQLAGASSTRARKQFPFWFREGMALFTARQGYLSPSLEDLARAYDKHPKLDPVRKGEAVAEQAFFLAYGAAYHAFDFLIARYGRPRVRTLLARMKDGSGFDDAFGTAIGISVDAFIEDFERYVQWRGFSDGRLPRGFGAEKPKKGPGSKKNPGPHRSGQQVPSP